MKKNLSITISVATLLFLAVNFYLRNNRRADSIKREAIIQTAETGFLKLLNDKNAFIDSTYFSDDTLLYYNKGTYLGMAAIVEDTTFYYGNDAYLGKSVTITE